MNDANLKERWKRALHRDPPGVGDFEKLAEEMVELHRSRGEIASAHLKGRWKGVEQRTGVAFNAENFDVEMAKAFIADELGIAGWEALEHFIGKPESGGMLFRYAKAAMARGDFTALEEAIGPESFHDRIVAWKEAGLFDGNQETLDEILAAACMLGQTETARYLIEAGIDPYAGMRTWLAGPHWAASSGQLETVKMLLEKKVPLEVENKYGGTILGQALWSAVNEQADEHAEIIERLIAAGARVTPGTVEWWQNQDVPSAATKERVAAALART